MELNFDSVQYLFFFAIITKKGNCMFQNDVINVIIISVLWKNLCFSDKIHYNLCWNSKREINAGVRENEDYFQDFQK